MLQTSGRVALLVAIPVVVLLVVPGPFFGFDIPKLIVVALVAAAGAPAGVAWAVKRSPHAPLGERLLLGGAAALVLVTLTSMLTSGVAPVSALGEDGRFVGAVVIVASVLLVVIVPAVWRTPAHVELFLGVLAGTLVAFVGYVLIQRAGLDPAPWADTWGTFPVGTVGNPNFVGAVIGLGAPLGAGLVLRRVRWPVRLAGVVLLVLTVLALQAARSRLGFVAAVVGVTVVLALLPALPAAWPAVVTRLRRWVAVAVPLGSVLAGGAAIVLGVVLDDRNALARWWFWRTAVSIWREAPLLGVGPGRFRAYNGEHRDPDGIVAMGIEVGADSAHAWPPDLLATTGLLGVAALVVVLVGAGLVLARHLDAIDEHAGRARVAIVAGLLAAHGVQMATSVPTVATVWLGWLLLGVLLVPMAAPARSAARGGHRSRRPARGGPDPSGTMVVVAASVVLVAVVAVPASRLWDASNLTARSVGEARAERPDLALASASAAVEATPWWPFAWRQLLQAQIDIGEVQGIVAAGQGALERDPRDGSVMRVFGQLATQLDDIDEAARWYAEASELDPWSVSLNREIARWGMDTGRLDDAEQAVARLERVVTPANRRFDAVVSLREELDELKG